MLALILATSTMISCGSSSTDNSSKPADQTTKDEGSEGTKDEPQGTADENGLVLPLTQEKQELSVWLVYSGTIVSDLNEIEGVKKMEEITNVHINWIPVNLQEIGDKLGILLTSGDFPDIIYPASNGYPGGIEKGIEDGVIYPDHDTLIREYMPNYMAYLNSSKEADLEATADSGKMICIKNIVGGDDTAESEGTYQGVAYRKDILEDLGIATPTSIAEWHDALVKCKESGIEHPFMLNTTGGSFLSLAWGVSTFSSNYLQLSEDGSKLEPTLLMDGFGEYLETMRQWYSEGLIDPNFTSFNYYMDTPNSVENNQHVMYSLILSAFTGNNYYQMHMCNNEKEFLQPLVAPPVNGGKEIQDGSRIIAKDSMWITTSCKNPELAAKWLDFQYSKTGELLNWYGIEDVTYTIDADGKPQFTDFVLKNENNTPPSEVLEKYALNWGNSWLGKHNYVASEKVATAAAGGLNQQHEAVETWSAPAVNVALPRAWTLTDAEGNKINATLTSLQTLVQEYMINYIIGQDNTTFEDFKEKVMQYGYQDIIDTYSDCYARYLAR